MCCRPHHRRLPPRGKSTRRLKNRGKRKRRRRKRRGPRGETVAAGGGAGLCGRARHFPCPVRWVLRRRLGSRPAAAPERARRPFPQSPSALQMTNAPDAQLGFPAPRRVFTLMTSIGSKTHGNRECSPENGQEGPPRGPPAKAKPARRLNFQNESWYAAAAARIGAARSNQQAPAAEVASRRQRWNSIRSAYRKKTAAISHTRLRWQLTCRIAIPSEPEDHDQCSSHRNEMSNPA